MSRPLQTQATPSRSSRPLMTTGYVAHALGGRCLFTALYTHPLTPSAMVLHWISCGTAHAGVYAGVRPPAVVPAEPELFHTRYTDRRVRGHSGVVEGIVDVVPRLGSVPYHAVVVPCGAEPAVTVK